MTFLQSIFLFGLLAVSIPLLIHLFSRRKKEKIPFSSLYFLKQLENKKLKHLKLKQILLLLLRMCIVALIVIAFARPTLTGILGSGFSEDATLSAVLIIDNSLSTTAEVDGVPVFETIKAKAVEVLETLKDGDEIFLILTAEVSNAENENPLFDIDLAERKIKSLRESYRPGDMNAAVNSALSKLQSSDNLYREIFVLSDFQRTNFSDEVMPEENSDAFPIKFYLVDPVDDVLQNTGFLVSEIKNQILEQGKRITLRSQVKNFGQNEIEDTMVSLYLDGKRVSQKNVTLEPGETEDIEFNFIADKSGALEGLVRLEEDDFMIDNMRYFVADIPQTISLLIINDSVEENEFIEAVFSKEFNANIHAESISANKISSVDFRSYNVVIYNGFGTWTSSDVFRMKSFLAGGGGIILFPGENSDAASYNGQLATELSLPQITGVSGKNLTDATVNPEFLSISRINFEHPVFNGMFKESMPDIELPRVFKSVDIAGDARSNYVMMLSNNKPFFLEKNYEAGKIILVSSYPGLSWNSLPLSGIFAPLMHRSVYYLAQSNNVRKENLKVDDAIVFRHNGESADISTAIPSGETKKITPEIASDSYKITFNETQNPGIYTFKNGEKSIAKYAFNIDVIESDFKKISEKEMQAFFGESPYMVLKNTDDIKTSVTESRSGKEIGKYIVIAALLFLLFETVLQYEKSFKEDEV